MRFVPAMFLVIQSCSNHSSNNRILGRWAYLHAESLGDYSQNDSNSIKEFNRSKQGTEILFEKNGNFLTGRPEEARIFPFKKGSYTMSSNGSELSLRPDETLKISLTDSILKINTPNHATIVWRKISD